MSRVTAWNRDVIRERVRRAVGDGLLAGAQEAVITTREDMGGSGGGVTAAGTIGSARNTYRSSPAGGPPGVRTGHLWRSIEAVGPDELGSLRAAYGTNVPYGRHLEFGASPRGHGKYLAIPLHGKAQAAYIRAGHSVRAIPKLFPIRTMRGQLFLARKYGGARARVELWFLLRRSVRIPARPWAQRPVTVHADRIMAAIHQASRAAMGGRG